MTGLRLLSVLAALKNDSVQLLRKKRICAVVVTSRTHLLFVRSDLGFGLRTRVINTNGCPACDFSAAGLEPVCVSCLIAVRLGG